MRDLLIVLLISLVAYSLPLFFSDQLISPDDMIYNHYSSHLARTGTLGYRPPGDAVFGREGFVPRYFVYSREKNRQGETLPRKFPGFIFFWAMIKKVLPWGANRLVNPFCAVLSLALLFLIGRFLFPGGKEDITAVILLASTPVFIHRAYMYNSDIFNLMIFLLSLYLLLLAFRKESAWFHLLFGLSAGCFLWIRPTNAVYLIALLLFILLERKRLTVRMFFAFLIPIMLLGFGLLLYHKIFYGSYFTWGYTITHQPPETALTKKLPLSVSQILDYLSFHPGIWIQHMKLFPLSLTIGFPLLVLSVAGFFFWPAERGPRFSLFYLLLFVISILFFSNFATFGYDRGELTLHSSFLRYLLPTIALLPLFAARMITRFNLAPGRLLTVLVIFNLIIMLISPSGQVETILQSKYYSSCRSFLLDEINPDAVFFSHYWEKLVFPERLVYTHGTHYPGDDAPTAIRSVLARGREVFTTSHENDQKILQFLRQNYPVEEIIGPGGLSRFLQWAGKQSKLYPLRLYRVTGRKASDYPVEISLPQTGGPIEGE